MSPDQGASSESLKASRDLFKSMVENITPHIPKLKPYIPLPLPTQSIVNQYLERYPQVADPTFKPELFQAEFVRKRLDFIWNPKKYADFLKYRGYKVKILQGDAVNSNPPPPFPTQKEIDATKIVYVFQPYKKFDDFIGSSRQECSYSMKLLLGVSEDILFDDNAENIQHKHRKDLLIQRMVNKMGDIYIKKILTEEIPVLMRWDESYSSADSE